MSLRNGFLVVASKSSEYVQSANYCGHSIKDNYPDAHVTLFVSKEVADGVDHSAFDIVITEDVPNHVRAKLYALSKTPYSELTVYVDADMECMHTDVQNIWNEIQPEQDILITRIRPYNGKIAKWKTGEMIHHGGFFMYRSNPQTLKFMERWWNDYALQRSQPWPYNEEEVPIALQPWDQFTFWKLLNIDKVDINVGFFKDDARWNFVNGYKLNENKDPIVFYHHTIPSRHSDIGLKK
jgi:hypothetical protein